MPTAATAWNILGAKDAEQFNTGGGSLYLFPPPISYSHADMQAFMDNMSLRLWTDSSRTKVSPAHRPWCTLTSEGLKMSFKPATVEFSPNDGPKITKLTGTYEEAKLTFDALDIALSVPHYIDLMGESGIAKYYEAPASESRAKGTTMTAIGPTKMSRKVYCAYVSLGHPEFGDRCSVIWFYGELAMSTEGEFSISNPLKASVTVNCYEFPKVTRPNNMPIYMILEAPAEAAPTGWE
jgi:hypothetical protein